MKKSGCGGKIWGACLPLHKAECDLKTAPEAEEVEGREEGKMKMGEAVAVAMAGGGGGDQQQQT